MAFCETFLLIFEPQHCLFIGLEHNILDHFKAICKFKLKGRVLFINFLNHSIQIAVALFYLFVIFNSDFRNQVFELEYFRKLRFRFLRFFWFNAFTLSLNGFNQFFKSLYCFLQIFTMFLHTLAFILHILNLFLSLFSFFTDLFFEGYDCLFVDFRVLFLFNRCDFLFQNYKPSWVNFSRLCFFS